MPKIVKYIALGVIVLFATITVLSNIYVVDEGDRALIVRLGNIDRVEKPGLQLKMPFVESKIFYSLRTRAAKFKDLTAYTSDNQIVTGSLLVPYRIQESSIKSIYTKYGTDFEDNLLRRIMAGVYRESLGDVETMTVAVERDKIGLSVGQRLREQLAPFGILVHAENVKLANIDFSKQFDERIAAALNEKAEVERERQAARKKTQIAIGVRAQAKGTADAQREKADGEAYYNETTAKGEAKAIRLKADANAHMIAVRGKAEAAALDARAMVIKQRPELANLLRAEAAMRWDGKLPTRFIPGSALPLLDVSR